MYDIKLVSWSLIHIIFSTLSHPHTHLLCLPLFSSFHPPHPQPKPSPLPQYPDYSDVIEHPMDLRTIKNKIKCHTYDDLDEFLQDMFLIFENCIKYHKRHSKIGKAGASLKKFFEKRCADLGLKDLSLCSSLADSGVGSAGESTRRFSTRNRK